MLSREQLLHFSVHGWALKENVLSPEQIEQYKRALDRLAAESIPRPENTEDITNVLRLYAVVVRNLARLRSRASDYPSRWE